MRRVSLFVCILILASIAMLSFQLRATKAQDAPAGPTAATPTEIIDQMMGLIGQNKVDDATNLMEGFRNQPDARNAARDKLIHLREEYGNYHGYDIAAFQKFTPQFQTADVMAYYEQEPILLRFHFYRPTVDGPWNVLGFQITTSSQEITEILKETPVDYVARKAVK